MGTRLMRFMFYFSRIPCQKESYNHFFLHRQGSWKTGEKENGSSEEEKKLEEKVEENSQKAEV